jgi:hypothetical protein
MSEETYLGYIGGARLWFEPDPAIPALLVEATPQGGWLARLLSADPPRPFTLHRAEQGDEWGVRVIRVPYTPSVDRLIIELVEVLGSARYLVPGLVQLSMLEVSDATR